MKEIIFALALSAIVVIPIGVVAMRLLQRAADRFAVVRWAVYVVSACMAVNIAVFTFAMVVSIVAEYEMEAEERRAHESVSADE
jgi:heme/copper-type cytochrome/quinol oxidase subunit 2